MAKTLAERLRDCAQGVSLGADGVGWSPDPALLEEAADKIDGLHAELQYARDGLTKGRTRMREDNERLRAALAELLACHTESAGWSMSMLTDRAEFDAMLARSQERWRDLWEPPEVSLSDEAWLDAIAEHNSRSKELESINYMEARRERTAKDQRK